MHKSKLLVRWLAWGVLWCFGAAGSASSGRAWEAPPRLAKVAPGELGLDPQRLDGIDDLIARGIADKKLPGAVVLVGYRGKIVFHRAYGFRQVLPEPLPMLDDTLFDLASLTKPIATATSVMRLVEEGKVALTDRVGDHVPAFAVNGKDRVTVEQLLLHIGGLIPDNAIEDYRDGPQASIDNFLKLGLNYEPGTNFRYSDVSFQVLGELVRAKTGKDVATYASEVIFGPLGMTSTTYVPPEALKGRAAVTEQREGRWMIGEVHDPRAYAMGGVAGHAGLFGTAEDLAIYAQMMLGKGEYQGVRIMGADTVRRMTAGYEVPRGIRGLGWDKRSGYSSNRGQTMTDAAFGHGGFTGTAIWIDPGLDLMVIFLSNRLHPDGKGSVNPLAGAVGTLAADAVLAARAAEAASKPDAKPATEIAKPGDVLTGIDVLAAEGFKTLAGRQIGLITNHTGVNREGVPTRVVLHQAPGFKLVSLLSPEHGIAGKLDQPKIDDTTDPDTGLKVFSLYGADRKPSPESLAGIDTLVFDIQDIGCRFYTYVSTMGEAMRVAADKKLRFVVLDRPNPINGVDIAGPTLDAGSESFVGYHTIPLRHGMTVGELAKLLNEELRLGLDLVVVPCQGWQRHQHYDQTGLFWVNPSPNMRNLNQAILYPGVGLFETTNLSVGRGTDTPFELIGAPWVDGRRLAAGLNSLAMPGVVFVPTRFTPASSKFSGEACQGVQILITRRDQVDPIRVGLAIAGLLVKNHPAQWETKNYNRLLSSQKLYEAVVQGRPLDELVRLATEGTEAFRTRRQSFLMY